MEQRVFLWISQNGYPAIFSLLVLGIVGLPVPDETLLTFTGYLIYRGHLHPGWAFLAAFGGSACGITVSYTLGRTFGIALIHRYGRYLHLDEARIQQAHNWFERAGRWALTFGYFIPGVRHFTAYAAGMSDLEPHWFALFAYSGALVWATTFLSLGYFLGEQWETVVRQLHRHVLRATAAAAVLILLYWVWRRWRGRRS
ncbi:MAG TPA: DedA family protein [Bryobacteraceae bacterium]|nr:DedA family protein [Bryobacteraceae bacterium]